jgi:hypothetical protein
VGEDIIDLRANPRKRASNNNSRATEPKVVRGKSGGEARGRKVLASAEDAGRQRVPSSGSKDQLNNNKMAGIKN